MELEYYALSDVGKRREKNEDSFLANEQIDLFVVADGMGGHSGGEYASRLAVKTIEDIIETLENDPNVTLQKDADVRPGDYKSWLSYSIQVASNKVYEKAKKEPSLKGMGTTTVAILFRKSRAFIANVGDSRGYRVRKNKIAQITKDHSLVEEQLDAGMLSRDEVKEHKFKNIITRSVGFQDDVEVDVYSRQVEEGDVFLLCSDGLSNLVDEKDMQEVVSANSLKEACHHLIDIANERGGDDNITVILVRVKSVDLSEEEEEEPTLQM